MIRVGLDVAAGSSCKVLREAHLSAKSAQRGELY